MELDWDEIGRSLSDAIRNQRGYADHFDWPDKDLREWGIAQTFKEELERDGEVYAVSGQQHPGGKNYPPDYQMNMATGLTWGVEITELIDQHAVEKTKRRKNVFASWQSAELLKKFQALVDRKDKTGNVREGPYDVYVLLVHVDEPDLPSERLSQLLGGEIFVTCLIDRIYVLVSYDPKTQRYPLLRLFVMNSKDTSGNALLPQPPT